MILTSGGKESKGHVLVAVSCSEILASGNSGAYLETFADKSHITSKTAYEFEGTSNRKGLTAVVGASPSESWGGLECPIREKELKVSFKERMRFALALKEDSRAIVIMTRRKNFVMI